MALLLVVRRLHWLVTILLLFSPALLLWSFISVERLCLPENLRMYSSKFTYVLQYFLDILATTVLSL